MRVIERFLALILALALPVGAVLLALEVGWAVTGHRPLFVPWHGAYTSGQRKAWDTAPARIIAVVSLLVGLLLLLAELKPRRPSRLAMTPGPAGVDAAITRASLRTTLRWAAAGVDGISGATAKVTKRRAKVSAVSRLGSPDTAQRLTGELDRALRGRLDALKLAKPPKLRARVAPRRGAGSA